MSFAMKYRNLLLIAVICVASILAEQRGYFTNWNQNLGDARMALSPKIASGQIVFVAVDAQSLTAVGSWPWSRRVHAALLDAIVAGGAVDVLFDFDFTFPSDPIGDRAFQEALERAGGATYLAVFEQGASVSNTAAQHFNLPLPAFADRSWPALVNVLTDTEGFVRDYPVGADLGGTFVSSAGALMANQLGAAQPPFGIDFSIRPETIPLVSAIDLLNGAVPAGIFNGKSVIIGASAVELSDQLAIPVHGVAPGPLIHALAAETLIGDLELHWLRAEWIALCLIALLFFLYRVLGRSPVMGLISIALGLAAIEMGSLAIFRNSSVLVPTAMLYPGLIGFGLWRFAQALSIRNWQLLRASAQARTTLSLLKRVFDDSSDGIVIFKSDGTVLRHSYSAQAMFGVDDTGTLLLPDKLRKLALGTAVPQGNDTLPPQLIEVETGGERRLLEYRATKSEVELSQGFGDAPEPEKITTLVVRDITQIKEQEQDIAYLSNYDDRTGALRRGAFLAFLGLRLEEERGVIVFALTLDRLKTINVTLGRAVGDALLKEVVARIERSPLHLSAVVRLGGTNFAFYTEGAFEPEKSHQLAQAVLHEVAQPYRLENVNAQIDARIGYTCVEEDSDTSAALALEQAEEAMDATKQIGAPIASYDHSAWEKQRRARQIERAMEGALANNEFNLLYQPQHDVTDGRLVGAEALIRWDSPVFGMVSPDEFITIAESTGFIVEIGKWTLEQAATDALTLPSDMTIAVNVSGIQIMRSDFARDVDAILRKVGVPANRICLELTETVFLASTSSIIETMQDVSFLGITWALDDFGTGFSSMKYLSKMPLDKVKLDKSFTMKLGQDPSARPILHSTSELCRGLGVKLLCEGVETQEQLGVLLEEGCAEAQGYFFGKPMPVDQLVPNAQIARERQLS